MIKKKNISQEDINTWKNYIKSPTDIIDKDSIQSENNSKNIRFKYVKKTVTSSQFDLSQGDLSRDLSLNLQEENVEKASLSLGTKILI